MTAPLDSAELRLHWRQLPPLPDPIGFAGAFAGTSGGALLVAGGANFPDKMPWEGGRKVWHDTAFVLDRANGVWRHGFKLPRPLGYGVSVTARAGVVCIGGSDASQHVRDVFRLTWKNGELKCLGLTRFLVGAGVGSQGSPGRGCANAQYQQKDDQLVRLHRVPKH